MTNEDKLAIRLADELDRSTLDLDRVGVALANITTNLIVNRLGVIYESAQERKEEANEQREQHTFRY